MTSQPRPVWLNAETVVAINQALIEADQRGVNERWLTWNLGAIVAAWDAAPADAAEAVRVAMTTPSEAYPEIVLGPILADGLTPAVLCALGYPRTEQA